MKHNTALSCTGRDANKRHVRILYLSYLNTKSFLSKILSNKPKNLDPPQKMDPDFVIILDWILLNLDLDFWDCFG